MEPTKGNKYYNDHRKLKMYQQPPEEKYHKFMVFLKYYTALTLTVWGEQCGP